MDAEDDYAGYVSFELAHERYAFPIDRVHEIIRMPAVVRVPLGPPSLVGLAKLRGRALPVVDLRVRCGLPPAGPDETTRVIVVEGRVPLGLVVDRVTGVLGADPATVRTTVDSDVLIGTVKAGDGAMIGVLALDRLLGSEFDRAAARNGGEEKAGQGEEKAGQEEIAGREENPAAADDEETFVVFRLDGQEYAVAVDAVQEIIRMPDVLIRVPRSHDFVEGLVNLRGTALPVVDLRTRLGLRRIARDERQRIAVLTIGGVRTGFIVDSVAEVARLGRHLPEPAPDLSAGPARVVSRVANLPGRKRMLLLVEPDQLLAAGAAAEPAEALAAV